MTDHLTDEQLDELYAHAPEWFMSTGWTDEAMEAMAQEIG